MRRKINIIASLDWLTVFIFIILVFLGWMNIYAAVYNEEHQSILDITQRYGKQLLWIIAAFILAIIVLLIESRFYELFSYIIYGIIVLLLITVLIFGKEVHGAKSWIPFGQFNFQPSEFAKFATGLTLASFLSTPNLKLHNSKTLFIILIIIAIPAGLILLQNDTGSALVYIAFILPLYREGLTGLFLFIGILAVVLFISALIINNLIIIIAILISGYILFFFISKSIRYSFFGILIIGLTGLIIWLISYLISIQITAYFIIIISLSIAAIIYLIAGYFKKLSFIPKILLFVYLSIGYTFLVNYAFHNILEEHQQRRINILLGIESDPLGVGYNVNQSKIAIGSGGINGKGYLQGTQTKFNFVPEQSTDFIFCTVGEEWGFIGSTVVIILFLLLLFRLIILAERQRSSFSRTYGYCVVSILFFHIAVNISMTIGLVPVIGIPLPFFSYGGSSLWAYTIMLFIFLKLDATRMLHLK